ncbi:MAG: NUDIX hydrolase [Thermoleophilia bacterium]
MAAREAHPAGDAPSERWRTVASRRLLDSPWLAVDEERVMLPDGAVIPDYLVTRGRPWGIVVALAGDGDLLLVRQYKHGIRRITLELPAGFIEPGESPAEGIARELREETGYAPGELRVVASMTCDPTRSDQVGHVAVATGCRRDGPQRLDPNERVEVVTVAPARALDLVGDGTIDVQGTIAALLIGLRELGLLRLAPRGAGPAP